MHNVCQNRYHIATEGIAHRHCCWRLRSFENIYSSGLMPFRLRERRGVDRFRMLVSEGDLFVCCIIIGVSGNNVGWCSTIIVVWWMVWANRSWQQYDSKSEMHACGCMSFVLVGPNRRPEVDSMVASCCSRGGCERKTFCIASNGQIIMKYCMEPLLNTRSPIVGPNSIRWRQLVASICCCERNTFCMASKGQIIMKYYMEPLLNIRSLIVSPKSIWW